MKIILDNLGTILAIWFGVMSVILFFMMLHDKRLSRRHGHRISERALFLLAIFGGADLPPQDPAPQFLPGLPPAGSAPVGRGHLAAAVAGADPEDPNQARRKRS